MCTHKCLSRSLSSRGASNRRYKSRSIQGKLRLWRRRRGARCRATMFISVKSICHVPYGTYIYGTSYIWGIPCPSLWSLSVMYVYTCYVLINPPMPIHYVLAAVFASCFYVLILLLQEWGHIYYYVLTAVFASCFYVLFKIRFVIEATKGGPLNTLYTSLRLKYFKIT